MSTTNPNNASSSSAPSSNRPPVTLPPTSHLDPGAYIRGTHPITFGEHNLIHPRVLLTTTTHPLNIGTNNIISEKAFIGGTPTTHALGSSSSTTLQSTTTTTNISSPDPSTTTSNPPTPQLPSSHSTLTNPTTLHSHIHIHPSAQICHSTTLHSGTIIESHAIIHPGVIIGAHSKICANVTVTSDVPEWTVVYGDGNLRRSRRPKALPVQRRDQVGLGVGYDGDGAKEGGEEEQDQAAALLWRRVEEAEQVRIKGMDREREATSIILRNAARAAVAAKRQSVQR
jgi:acetyltransferase-like isoleucine patch superfamily enzyme